MIGTLAAFRADAMSRGDAVGPDDDAAEAALVRAWTYLRAHYPAAVAQEAASLEECLYIVAAVELATPGAMSRSYAAGERKVLTEVSGIKWTVVPGDPQRAYPVLTLVDGLLRGDRLYIGGLVV